MFALNISNKYTIQYIPYVLSALPSGTYINEIKTKKHMYDMANAPE
jgi:hypothetical protein